MSRLRGPAFVFSNQVSRPYCVASAIIDSPDEMEPERIRNEEPADFARIPSLNMIYTRFRFDFLSGDFPVDVLSIVNSNLSPGGMYRYVSGEDEHFFVEVAPTAVGSLNNTSFVPDDIGEGIRDGADSNSAGPIAPSQPWWFEVTSWTGAPTNPRTGSRMATFAIFATLFGDPINALPCITCTIKESGVPISEDAVHSRAVTAKDGQYFYFSFDPALLADISLADMSLQVTVSIGDNDSYAEIGTVSLVMEDGDVVFELDTGWLVRPTVSVDADYDGPEPTVDLPAVLPETVSISPPSVFTRIVAMLVDDQADHDPVRAGYWDLAYNQSAAVRALRRTPDGYIDGGTAVIGGATFIGIGPLYGSAGPQSPPIVEQLGGSTAGGQSFGVDAYRRRHIIIEITVTRDELDMLKDRLVWRRGLSGPFYFFAEPDVPRNKQVFNSGYVTLVSMSPETQVSMQYDNGDGSLLYTTTLEMEGKL